MSTKAFDGAHGECDLGTMDFPTAKLRCLKAGLAATSLIMSVGCGSDESSPSNVVPEGGTTGGAAATGGRGNSTGGRTTGTGGRVVGSGGTAGGTGGAAGQPEAGVPDGGDSDGSTNGTGGSANTGGATGTGGATATGGATGAGGSADSGSGSGGVTSTGGGQGTGGGVTGTGGQSNPDAGTDDAGDGAPDSSPTDAGADADGSALLAVTIQPAVFAMASNASKQFSALVANDSSNAGVTWTVSSPGTIDTAGNLTVSGSPVSANVVVTATSVTDPTKSASATVHVVAPGQVLSTGHPLVAKYDVSAPSNAKLSVEFGQGTSYGFTTSVQDISSGNASQLVAGMQTGTLYHMRAIIEFADGSVFQDADQTFTSGALPSDFFTDFSMTTTTTQGAVPQPGVEMINLLQGSQGAVATDLAGNVIWYYEHGAQSGNSIQPIKQLANGHYIVVATPGSTEPTGTQNPTAVDVVREIDLAGQVVKEITGAQLASRLPDAVTAGCTECDFVHARFHHDVEVLPNGHWLVMSNEVRLCGDITGCTGDPATKVLGDVIVDLDQNLNPVWAWNHFNHLDVNQRPFQFPDWTHSNAIAYSKTDGNLLISVRHFSWVVKVAYENGAGNGDVIWRLGDGGDFTLASGTEPEDWQNAQHNPTFVSTSTAGTFDLTMFDNGTYRPFSNGCGTSGTPPCSYSTIPIFRIDESAMSVTPTFRYTVPKYSNFGGSAELLANGNIHYAQSAIQGAIPNRQSETAEITTATSPEVVWTLHTTGRAAYRTQRLPSLYPGVQW